MQSSVVSVMIQSLLHASAASVFESNNIVISLENDLWFVESFVCKTAGAVQEPMLHVYMDLQM